MVPRGWPLLRIFPRLFSHRAYCWSRGVIVGHNPKDEKLFRTPRVPFINCQIVQVRSISSEDFDSDTEDTDALDASSETYRSFLYPEENHPLFVQLNESKTVQDVFVFMHKHQHELTPVLTSQAVMVLWDLQRLFLRFSTEEYLTESIFELKNYIKGVNGHPDFESLVRSVGEHCEEFDPDTLTCVLLYLGKMGVELSHPVMQNLVARCTREFETFPLTALSRYLVACQQGNNMKTLYIIKDVLPLLLQKLKITDDADDFRLLAICFCHLTMLSTPTIFDAFMSKTRELIEKGVIGPHTPKTVIKVLNFMNFNRDSKYDTVDVHQLLGFLEGKIRQLRTNDIVILNRTLLANLETAKLLDEMDEFITRSLANQDPLAVPIDLLLCSSTIVAPHYSVELMEKILEEHITSNSFGLNFSLIYKLLRKIKTPNKDLCDLFWKNTIDYMKKNSKDHRVVLGAAYKYLNFNNNMGGTYRLEQFENISTDFIQELMRGPYRYVTNIASRSASYLLAYSKDGIPPDIFEQVLTLSSQFSAKDCHHLSKGVMASTNIRNGTRSPVLLDQIVKISSVINSCIRSVLQGGENISLAQNDTLMRSYRSIRGVSGTDLHENLLQNYSRVNLSDMSGRVVHDLSNTFISNKCLIPSAIGAMEEYVIKNGPFLLGSTVEKFVWMMYSLGYSSPNTEESVRAACEVILRDTERFKVLSLLMSSMALNFYQQLPVSLVHFIFTVEFLERVDAELKACYSRAVYPVKVRQLMMELNRAVCIDCPQADIPWFHEKFCQENVHSTYQSAIHKEVFNTLCQVTGGPDFVKQNAFSPYYHTIDFEIILDEAQKPISIKDHKNMVSNNITKWAITVNRDASFTNGKVQLCGPALLKKRHLEILGYRQLDISQFIWQAMYMSEEASRQKFIAEKIWPHRRKENVQSDEDLVIF